jgi:hypothetical protein
VACAGPPVCCLEKSICAQITEPCLGALTIWINIMKHVRRPIASNKA